MTHTDTTQSLKTEFKIDKVTFTVKPLTIAQFRKFMALIGKVSEKEMSGWKDLLEILSGDGLKDFMIEIIFPGQGAEKVDWEMVEFDLVDEIIDSFLALNPRLKNRLKSFFSIFSPMIMTVMNPGT